MKLDVIKEFRDKETGQIYQVGSSYEVKENKRADELVEKGFLLGESADFPKHTGGGYYELSNGEKVKGKDDALAAEAELKEQGE